MLDLFSANYHYQSGTPVNIKYASHMSRSWFVCYLTQITANDLLCSNACYRTKVF